MLLKNVLFTVTIVTLFFLAAEAVLALFVVRPVLLTEDPLVGFAENVPQFAETTHADGSVMLETANNKRGLFNYQAFPRHKGDNSYRIFCMGGSTTYGRPYSDPVSFCGWLRAYLKAAAPARNWEVVNAGAVSFASYRVARLMNELTQYDPDLFIVYTGQNEFLERRSYGTLQTLPAWLINLDATLSGTRTYSAMRYLIDALRPDSLPKAQQRSTLTEEVDEILNHTAGPESYRRDNTLKQQIVTHFRLNLRRMIKIAHNADSDILFVQPAINIKDMSPFKSEHREGLDKPAMESWQSLYAQGSELLEAGEVHEALEIYRQARDIDDRYAELHYRIGQALFRLQRYDEAERAFRRAVEEDVVPLRILDSMQRILTELTAAEGVPLVDFPGLLREAYLQDYGHAVFGAEYFRDHVHTNMDGYRLLGVALFDELVEQGVVTPAASWNSASMAAVEREVSAKLDPMTEGYAMLNLGKVLAWAGKFAESYSAFKRALEVLGPNPFLYDRLARCSFMLGNTDDAAHYLRKTLALYPDTRGAHSKLAMILRNRGKTQQAIKHCRAELQLDPENHYVHAGLAELLAAQGDSAAALHHYTTALELEPDHEFAHIKLARFLIEQDRYDEALTHGQAALRINPQQHRAHNALGLIMKHQGKIEEAVYHFSMALRLAPGDILAQENLQLLRAEGGKSDIVADL
jgi:tetratricopeptide (TPR) repeat protein